MSDDERLKFEPPEPDRSVIESDEHDIDPASGYCKRCGSHRETIAADDMLCLWGETILAFSHRRHRQMREKAPANG